MLFNAVTSLFQSHRDGQRTYSCFPGVLFTGTLHNTLSNPLAASHIAIVKTLDSDERGVNHVAMTIINP